MTGLCTGNTAACTGLDLRPVRFSTEEPSLLCAGCRATPLGREGTVVERRVTRQSVPLERRFRPRWLRRAAAKDLSGTAR